MKLSELEALVKAMKASAKKMKVVDPNVTFWEPKDQPTSSRAFHDTEPFPYVINELRNHVVTTDGTTAKRGDFAIPTRRV